MSTDARFEVARYKLNPGNGYVVAVIGQGALRFQLETNVVPIPGGGETSQKTNLPLSIEEARLLVEMTKPGV